MTQPNLTHPDVNSVGKLGVQKMYGGCAVGERLQRVVLRNSIPESKKMNSKYRTNYVLEK